MSEYRDKFFWAWNVVKDADLSPDKHGQERCAAVRHYKKRGSFTNRQWKLIIELATSLETAKGYAKICKSAAVKIGKDKERGRLPKLNPKPKPQNKSKSVSRKRCYRCSQAISVRRLRTLPNTRICLKCETALKNAAKTVGSDNSSEIRTGVASLPPGTDGIVPGQKSKKGMAPRRKPKGVRGAKPGFGGTDEQWNANRKRYDG